MKIPKKYREFYKECSSMLKRIIEKKSTIKREAYAKKEPSQYLAFLDKLVQNYDLLEKIIKANDFLRIDTFYSVILCYEIMNNKINNHHWKKKFDLSRGECEVQHIKRPKYIRLNTLKAKEEDLVGLECTKTQIPNIYKLETNINFSENNLFKDGKLIVQNIASCLPAYLLSPEEGSKVIDGCSAPGNKTSHLSAIMNNTGKIYAVEVDKYRFKVMKNRLNKLGVKNTNCLNEDFFDLKLEDYKGIDYILIDPTCSGSGIHDYYIEDKERTEGLQKFQVKLLQHAMNFNAKKIVYSTCSINREEGEDVIEMALKDSEYVVLDVSEQHLNLKENGFTFNNSYIRCNEDKETGAIGFFACVLVKKS